MGKIAGGRSSEKERRKFMRLKAHHLLKYRVIDEGEGKLSFVRNISAGGALFVAKEEIPCGSMVELEINFPQYPHPVKVVSKVVRSRPLKKMGGFEIGAEFVSADEEVKEFINKKILSIAEKSKE
ncbi:PilZ domain-containing protein [Candidatus Omnitrophota bacterium]